MRSVCFWLASLVLLGVLFGCGSGRGRVRETALLQSPSAETEVVRFGSAEQLSGDLEILSFLVEDAAHDWPAEEAARAAALLLEAADYLEAQAREAGGALTCRVQGVAGRLCYAGDLCPTGEDGMLLNAAAEAFLDADAADGMSAVFASGGQGDGLHNTASTSRAGRFGALARRPQAADGDGGTQTAYMLLVNAPGEGYALPQLCAGEAELFREKAVIFCRDATPAQVAAQLARLFAPGGKVFSGAALSPEGGFSAEFRAYLAGGESKV